MRTLTLIAIVGIIIPSMLSLIQKNDQLPILERIINSLARMVKLSMISGFAFGIVGFGTAFIYYISPYLGFSAQAETIELSSIALKYYAIIGVLLPIIGVLLGSILTKRQAV